MENFQLAKKKSASAKSSQPVSTIKKAKVATKTVQAKTATVKTPEGKGTKKAVAKKGIVKKSVASKSEPIVADMKAPAKTKATTKPKTQVIQSWYDYPDLYEMGFLKETPKEAVFLGDVFKKYVPFPVNRVLELGCGSGRLICEMAEHGFAMTGLDLNTKALDYCKKKLKKKKKIADLVVGDMTNFSFDQPFDAAVNAINTFRHLETEEAALFHLQCVAKHLKPGGVFVLSLHLLPPDGDLWGTERWSAKDGDLSVSYALTVVETSMKTRLEKLRISMLVKNKGEAMRLSDHITLRIYTAKQLKSLLAKATQFKLIGVHDFWCDIESTQKLNGESIDTVLILQRV